MLNYEEIKGIIRCETGLRIGGKESTAEIGGVDNPVIRNPLDGFPYIPGSSLKGKIRFLLEHAEGKIDDEGNPHECNESNCMICKVFGKNANKENESNGIEIGRAIFRDAFLTEDSKEELKKLAQQTGLKYVEIKTENVINRKKGTAEHPRDMERVPAGTEFEFSISIRIFENDNKEEIINFIKKGLSLLEKDTLGGSGSRGYGKIKIKF
ncbi:MAG: type III-A CRISPR-associated RAMP protein Csm3 [Candidatus Goldbacteria bacterium]|nr:type III-A CRISPR-associated RAMP protein Csm3 [Candidatus Goldiibacteriota bacterium]